MSIPDGPLAREATALLREAGPPLLLNHSLRSFLFGSVQGHIRGQSWDPELLYVGAIFHDLGITETYRSAGERFEVDGANAASAFLHEHGLPEDSIGTVWKAVALHSTAGIPPYKRPEISLLQSGVILDLLGFGFDEIPSLRRVFVHSSARAQAAVSARAKKLERARDDLQRLERGLGSRHYPTAEAALEALRDSTHRTGLRNPRRSPLG